MLAAIVFDFDGVILESVDIKTRAFCRVFHAYPEHRDRIAQLHLANGGLSRYEKFRRIYADFLHLPLTDSEMQRLDREFGAIVASEIRECAFVAGAREFLETHAAERPLYVASGTPEQELRDIVRLRGLEERFVGVFGSPRSKRVLLEHIVNELQAPPSSMLFIGDAKQDWEAASAIGVPFVGRLAPGTPNPFPTPPLMTVEDLSELQRRWPELISRFN